jgi:phosphoribosylformylglycinamidine synthase subunit PurL
VVVAHSGHVLPNQHLSVAVRPGADAGVVRVHGTRKALAFTSDVNPRYCFADPFEGGKQAVAEAWRNLVATGARPLAATDNLNFGNPERPEIMGQFVRAIEGIAEACRVLEFPIVSGNVSLYNETNGRAIPPTPAIGGVGLIEDRSKMVRGAFAAENERILLIGAPEGWGTHLGRSAYLRELHGLDIGPPPPVDLEKEKLTGAFVRALIGHGVVTAVHDLSDGGLAVALAEMAIASGIGARVNLPFLTDPIPIYFGEDQGRYLVTISKEDEKLLRDIGEEAQELGLHAPWIGETGGDTLNLFGANAIPVAELKAAHESWFPGFMDG